MADACWLTLVRHARAAPSRHEARDAARELTERGRRDAVALGALIADRGEAPPIDRILCSSAARTRETLSLLKNAAPMLADVRVDVHDALYLASADALAHELDRALEAGCRHVLLVGHNPGLERLCARLSQAPGLVMDTAARCTFELDSGPCRVSGGTASLRAHDVARG